MTASMIIAAVLTGLGFLFMLASLIGIVRFPDFFARLHAQGVGDTIGAFLMLAGMIAAVGANLLSVKILLIFIIILLTNPLGTNLMMIAAINEEDYQGYSTFMSGGTEEKQKEPDPVTKAELPAEAAETESINEAEIHQPGPAVSGDDEAPDDMAGSAPERKKKNADKSRSRRRKPSMNMNRTELLKIAAERGIEVPEEATKREILSLIYSKHDKNNR